jgi:hypothetical protein
MKKTNSRKSKSFIKLVKTSTQSKQIKTKQIKTMK